MLRLRGLALATALAVAACGHAPSPAGDPTASLEARVERLTALDARVAPTAWRLAVANADLCPTVRLKAGWTLQAASQFGAEVRSTAERLYGLQGDLPGVSTVAPGSPADRAGLSTGDLILTVNDEPLAAGPMTGVPAFDGLDANATKLDEALQAGPARLRVRHAGLERLVDVTPIRACPYETQVEVLGSLRSRADGRRIFISDGFLAILGEDDELAFVLAHELAHNVLRHRRSDLTGAEGPQFGAIRLRKGLSLSSESDADRAGLWLLARAGYDPAASLGFFDTLLAAWPAARFPQANAGGVYASAPDRKAALEPVVEEIAVARRDGRPLIP